MNSLTTMCQECDGEGHFSECCGFPVEHFSKGPAMCGSCGKFCRTDVCWACEGTGHVTYEVGDDVDIIITLYSPEWLKEILYQPSSSIGAYDSKDFSGKIMEIVDDFNVYVRIKYYKHLLKLPIDELLLT